MSTRRQVIAGLGSVAAGLATSGWPRQAEAARRIDNDDLLIFFDTLALMRRGARGQSARPSHVRKWKGPVKVRTRGAGAVAHRATLEALLEETSTLTGVPFRRAIDVEPLDNLLTLYFLSAAEMDRLYGPDKNNVCYTNTRGRRGVLRTARLRVRDDFADCLHHEFMHALGFDNHWPSLKIGIGAPSALANRHAPERARGYSEWDRMAIRLLYHPRLKPRTPRLQALATARQILPDLLIG